jgi:hypothetical protein
MTAGAQSSLGLTGDSTSTAEILSEGGTRKLAFGLPPFPPSKVKQGIGVGAFQTLTAAESP